MCCKMNSLYVFLIYVLCLLLDSASSTRLSVCSYPLQDAYRKFCFGNSPVYLSGMNQAWSSRDFYAFDFGNFFYNLYTKSLLEDKLRGIREAGGNSIRIFVHTDSQFTPAFNNDGSVGAADHSCNHIIREMKEYLCAAQQHNIFVFFVLWNGAFVNESLQAAHQLNGLITRDDKLTSYIDNALIPIVQGLRGFRSLGGYDIINEPEGIVINTTADQQHPHPCHAGVALANTGAGWAIRGQHRFWMYRLQRFINRQASAIKAHDPDALVTVGSWRETAYTPIWSHANFLSDACLQMAGGQSNGVLDFYQIHTYKDDNAAAYHFTSPMVRPAWYFNLNKPLVIGEFSVDGGVGPIENLVSHAYLNGYAGAWSWHAAEIDRHSDDFDTQARGLSHIRLWPGVQFSSPLSPVQCPRPYSDLKAAIGHVMSNPCPLIQPTPGPTTRPKIFGSITPVEPV